MTKPKRTPKAKPKRTTAPKRKRATAPAAKAKTAAGTSAPSAIEADLSDLFSSEPRTFVETGHPADLLREIASAGGASVTISAEDINRAVEYVRDEPRRAAALVGAENARRKATAGRRDVLKAICFRLCQSIVKAAKADGATTAATVAALPQTGEAIARAMSEMVAAGFVPAQSVSLVGAVQFDSDKGRGAFAREVLRDCTGIPDLMDNAFFKSLLTGRAKAGRAKEIGRASCRERVSLNV